MNGCNETDEYLCLKQLLDNWKLPHLLYHFLAQKINVDVLKMMKTTHTGEAMSGVPLGDRIRFEYELENWREMLGIPLGNSSKPPDEMLKNPPNGNNFKHKADTIENNTKTKPMVEMPKATTQKASQLPTVSAIRLQQTITSTVPIVSPLTIKKLTQNMQKSPLHMITPCSSMRSKESSICVPPVETPPTSKTVKKRPYVDFVPPKELIASPLTLDARTILMQCVPRGPQLIHIYQTRGNFTQVERGELINLFAKFFYQRQLHLSLKMSHALENQILKLFPGENLIDYRTEKRGRIYIRLGNIKNFKARTARNKRIQEAPVQQQFVISNVEEEDEDNSIMIDDEFEEVPTYDESNSPDPILCDDVKNDAETDYGDHFLYKKVKTEAQDDGDFEPETQQNNGNYKEEF